MTAAARRILAVIDLDSASRAIARHAWMLAARDGARLALAHQLDWGAGCDDFSPLTPPEVEQRLTVVVQRRLERMAAEIGAGRAATLLVAYPAPSRGWGELARTWQPDLIVASVRSRLVTDNRVDLPGWSCAGLALSPPRMGFLHEAADRFRDGLSSRFRLAR